MESFSHAVSTPSSQQGSNKLQQHIAGMQAERGAFMNGGAVGNGNGGTSSMMVTPMMSAHGGSSNTSNGQYGYSATNGTSQDQQMYNGNQSPQQVMPMNGSTLSPQQASVQQMMQVDPTGSAPGRTQKPPKVPQQHQQQQMISAGDLSANGGLSKKQPKAGKKSQAFDSSSALVPAVQKKTLKGGAQQHIGSNDSDSYATAAYPSKSSQNGVSNGGDSYAPAGYLSKSSQNGVSNGGDSYAATSYAPKSSLKGGTNSGESYAGASYATKPSQKGVSNGDMYAAPGHTSKSLHNGGSNGISYAGAPHAPKASQYGMSNGGDSYATGYPTKASKMKTPKGGSARPQAMSSDYSHGGSGTVSWSTKAAPVTGGGASVPYGLLQPGPCGWTPSGQLQSEVGVLWPRMTWEEWYNDAGKRVWVHSATGQMTHFDPYV